MCLFECVEIVKKVWRNMSRFSSATDWAHGLLRFRRLKRAAVTLSVYCLTTHRTNGVRSPAEANDVFSRTGSQTVEGAPPGGLCWSSGEAQVLCMREMFILNEYERR